MAAEEKSVPPTILAGLQAAVLDPDTPPERLREILRFPFDLPDHLAEPGLLKASRDLAPKIVAHPNVSLDMLLETGLSGGMPLLAQHPEAFLNNPAAPLFPLEHPDFAERVGPPVLLRLLAFAAVPPAYVAMARGCSDDAVRDAAAHHIRTIGELDPDGLAWEVRAREWLLGIPPRDKNAVWERIDIGEAPAWVAEPFQERYGPPWWREEPMPDIPQARARAFALHPATPADALEALARSSEPGVRTAVYANPSASDVLRERIRAHGRTYLEYAPFDLWYFLMVARLPLDEARYSGMPYPAGSTDFVRNPARLLQPLHRLALAVNPTLPPERRASLADDGHAVVRAAAQAFQRRGTALWKENEQVS